LPKETIERLIVEQNTQKALDGKNLKMLMKLVNEELDAGNNVGKENISHIDLEFQELLTDFPDCMQLLKRGGKSKALLQSTGAPIWEEDGNLMSYAI
jgi:hypothetical protein